MVSGICQFFSLKRNKEASEFQRNKPAKVRSVRYSFKATLYCSAQL